MSTLVSSPTAVARNSLRLFVTGKFLKYWHRFRLALGTEALLATGYAGNIPGSVDGWRFATILQGPLGGVLSPVSASGC